MSVVNSAKDSRENVHVVKIKHKTIPDTRVPMIFLLILRFLTLGKHIRLSRLEMLFFLGLLSANRVRARVRPGTLITSSSSYLVPAMGEIGFRLEPSRALGCAGSVPMLGEEVGSIIDRVEDGDLWLD